MCLGIPLLIAMARPFALAYAIWSQAKNAVMNSDHSETYIYLDTVGFVS
jgi:hypothetical protein